MTAQWSGEEACHAGDERQKPTTEAGNGEGTQAEAHGRSMNLYLPYTKKHLSSLHSTCWHYKKANCKFFLKKLLF